MRHSCWILRGHIENGVAVNYQAAVEFFTRAIDVLEWGREAWRDVPPDQRGAIFGDTFVRGVKCLQLDSYINVCSHPLSCPSLQLISS